jgi:hypothetical protein
LEVPILTYGPEIWKKEKRKQKSELQKRNSEENQVINIKLGENRIF